MDLNPDSHCFSAGENVESTGISKEKPVTNEPKDNISATVDGEMTKTENDEIITNIPPCIKKEQEVSESTCMISSLPSHSDINNGRQMTTDDVTHEGICVKQEKVDEDLDKCVKEASENGGQDQKGSLMGYRGDDEDSDSDGPSSSSDSSSDDETMAETSKAEEDKTKGSGSLKDNGGRKLSHVNTIKSLREEIRTRGEIYPDELPPLEDLTITVDESEEMLNVGKVTGIVATLVVVQSNVSIPALNEDSILFKENREVFGKIFEVFGPVCQPLYSVRFNSAEDIASHGVEIGQEVYCAPKKEELTHYVFVEQLKVMKGSDASWEDNHEPPAWVVEFSDDEEERRAKAKKRKSKQNQKSRCEENASGDGASQRNARSWNPHQYSPSNGNSDQSYRQYGNNQNGTHQLPDKFQTQQHRQGRVWRPKFPSNPWQQNWRPPHPGAPHGLVRNGPEMPGGSAMAPPMRSFPGGSPQRFAGPPQFCTGPNSSADYQHPPGVTIFGDQNMNEVGHHPGYSNTGLAQNSMPDAPPIWMDPSQGPQPARTSLLGPPPGQMDFRGAQPCYNTAYRPYGPHHQMANSHNHFAQHSFEQNSFVPPQALSVPSAHNLPPIDRRYIQNTNK